jgi:hypothetical protein
MYVCIYVFMYLCMLQMTALLALFRIDGIASKQKLGSRS